MENYQPTTENSDLDWGLLTDSVDSARFARRARWAVGIVTTLIAASLVSAIASLASAP